MSVLHARLFAGASGNLQETYWALDANTHRGLRFLTKDANQGLGLCTIQLQVHFSLGVVAKSPTPPNNVGHTCPTNGCESIFEPRGPAAHNSTSVRSPQRATKVLDGSRNLLKLGRPTTCPRLRDLGLALRTVAKSSRASATARGIARHTRLNGAGSHLFDTFSIQATSAHCSTVSQIPRS
jgi:hypothetical protein